MHTEARQRRSQWLTPPHQAREGRSWVAAAPLVGLGADDPGAGWGQAPTPQEKAQGYKKTDVMTLQIKCNALKAQIDELLANVDTEGTDAASLAALKTLGANVGALASAVAALASGQGGYFGQYPVLLLKYNGYVAELGTYGIEVASPPAAPSKGGAPPVKAPPVTLKPAASPTAPVITTKNKSSAYADYFLYGAIALAVIGVGYGVKLWKF